MDELSIRKNRGMNVPRFERTEKTGKAEKQPDTAQIRRPAGRAAATVSQTLRQLMSRVDQAGRQVREGRSVLRSGEAALAEVEDNLGRMEALARLSAGEGAVDRTALQKELELLRGEVERIAQEGVKAGLFQDTEEDGGLDGIVDAVLDSLSAGQEGMEKLPSWLVSALTGEPPSREELLAALGLSADANSWEILASLGNLSLEDGSVGSWLAAYYLGTVIAGGTSYGAIDPELAARGLQLFLDAVAQGVSPDEALELLTGGVFSGLEDFQARFSGGTAPGLELFLTDLLFSEDAALADASMLAMMAGSGDMEMLMNLLMSLGSGDNLLALLDGSDVQEDASESLAEGAAAGQGALPEQGPPPAARMEVKELGTEEQGTVQVSGKDLSGAALERPAGAVAVNTAQALTLRGMGREAPAIRLADGSETVTLQQVNTPALGAEGTVRVLSVGENELARLEIKENTVLTVDGGGLTRIGVLRGGPASVLRLVGGAVELDAVQGGARVVVDGAVSLLAAEGAAVQNAGGEALTPFDILWKTLLPEWSALTGLTVDGQATRLDLPNDRPDFLRMWLLRGEEDKGYPAHTIALRGRTRAGRTAIWYFYVRWDEGKGSFQPISMYPNPFTVTGGEEGVDWTYEEESHTLYILSGEVAALSGGAGTDAELRPFSGRIVLRDGIGAVELTLDGVECRVTDRGAFHLGQKNDVTLLLQRGTDNVFESGPGFAGISLGDGTSLCIDQAKGDRDKPDGTLTVTGGKGGAGIGRDRGAGQGHAGPILIRDGVIFCAASGGGAGIGGAVGAAVGDIRIQGGTVTAIASSAAAAIGAGIQGACGDVTITGSARVAQARGGSPYGDIGGCLFGNCGKVQVSAGTELGGAKLWTQKGLSIQVGEASLTIPRFHVSAKALRLEGLDISGRETAREAIQVIVSDRRWMTRLQGAYGAIYGQLGQSFSSMHNVRQYTRAVRDSREALSLTTDIREVLRLSPKARFLKERGMEDVGGLLRN